MPNSTDSACALQTVSNESGEQVLELINELDGFFSMIFVED
jgi:hypothetical protein